MANEQRLIDAHDLWSDIMMLPHNGDMISSEEVEQAIKNTPTVDAVEVVRCKDCKHQTVMWCWREEENRNPCRVGSNDFCSYGERRTDG